MKRIIGLYLVFILSSCTVHREVTAKTGFAKGADIGWLQQMEASEYRFYNEEGKEEDCFKILKAHGINTVRLRTWVNPSNDPISGHTPWIGAGTGPQHSSI